MYFLYIKYNKHNKIRKITRWKKMKINNKKGQGALEYLLLIGGAVLIAVIVIALLVGMGGQSRDTAADAADRAQQASDVPQPSQIVSAVASRSHCIDDIEEAPIKDFSWRPLGEGGSHALHVIDSSGRDLNVMGVDSLDPDDLDPTDLAGLSFNIDLTTLRDGTTDARNPTNRCGDSYYIIIKTTKNQQTVESQAYRFSWIN
jgi:hypothetical protein